MGGVAFTLAAWAALLLACGCWKGAESGFLGLPLTGGSGLSWTGALTKGPLIVALRGPPLSSHVSGMGARAAGFPAKYSGRRRLSKTANAVPSDLLLKCVSCWILVVAFVTEAAQTFARPRCGMSDLCGCAWQASRWRRQPRACWRRPRRSWTTSSCRCSTSRCSRLTARRDRHRA